MGLEEVEIGTEQLAPGMYVCRLDRPWTDTPFLLQGFTIGNDELAWLKSHCRSVWIDVVRGPGPRGAPLGTLRRPESNRPAPAVDPESLTGSVRYHDTATLEQELPEARRAHEVAAKLASRILDDVRAGQKVAPAAVRDAVAPIVGSVLRSADTMFWVNALQKLDAYSYSHAINCSALAAAFGRHLGLPEAMLVDLASGGLLLDVGKARLPEQLLSHPGPLDAAQTAQVREHVAHGLAILDEGEHGHAAIEMVSTHHERWDGSGYPRGLGGTAIPMFGRMAGIIDSFDAMTSQRPHAAAIARHEALQQIYRHCDTLYQGEMVEQFIGCLGVYPTGSLVELSTGEVAVVMAQNPTRRLRPRVMLLTDPDKKLRDHFVSLDLMVQAEGAPREQQINVTTPLPIGAYGLDPAELYL